MCDLSAKLKPYLEHALATYDALWQESIPMDAKGFTAFHNACKAVLSHIALLERLIRLEQPFDASHQDTRLEDWIQKARAAAPYLLEDNPDDSIENTGFEPDSTTDSFSDRVCLDLG